jgi:hypothetical protein
MMIVGTRTDTQNARHSLRLGIAEDRIPQSANADVGIGHGFAPAEDLEAVSDGPRQRWGN